MHYRTRFAIGDRIYAIGQPAFGCGCQSCAQDPLQGPKWNVLGVNINNLERFDPLTVEAVMILPGEDGECYGVYYSVREMPGELLPEKYCYTSLREAGRKSEALNAQESRCLGPVSTQ